MAPRVLASCLARCEANETWTRTTPIARSGRADRLMDPSCFPSDEGSSVPDSDRGPSGSRGYFPEVAVGIGEVAAVATPGSGLRLLGDRGPGTRGLRQHLVDLLARGGEVGQCEAVE